jgi:hypothetical protein
LEDLPIWRLATGIGVNISHCTTWKEIYRCRLGSAIVLWGNVSLRISRRQPLHRRRNRTTSQEINVVDATSAEIRKGRYGVLGGLLYLNAQAGTGERSGLVSKVDLGYQQYFGQLFASYRVIEGPRGWLDLLAGLTYTYLGEQVGSQANNMANDAASTELVDQFAQQLATSGSDVRALVQQNITDKLGALDGHNPKLPVGSVAAGEKGVIANLIQQLLQNQQGAQITVGLTF